MSAPQIISNSWAAFIQPFNLFVREIKKGKNEAFRHSGIQRRGPYHLHAFWSSFFSINQLSAYTLGMRAPQNEETKRNKSVRVGRSKFRFYINQSLAPLGTECALFCILPRPYCCRNTTAISEVMESGRDAVVAPSRPAAWTSILPCPRSCANHLLTKVTLVCIFISIYTTPSSMNELKKKRFYIKIMYILLS